MTVPSDPLSNWREEMRAVYLYRVLSEVEEGTPRAQLFTALAGEAEGQAGIWARSVQRAADSPPLAYRPDARTMIVAGLIRRLGPRATRGVLAAMKVRGLSVYSHSTPGHAMPTSVAEVGQRHQGVGAGGNLRASVFGVNDGLISNCSLILGVAGAAANNSFILLSGVAGLVAGAFSMAAGEYVSVRSQREMFEYQIGLERSELEEYPAEEAEELALIYEARGMQKAEAHELAAATIAEPERALDALAREELGLNPDELGSPWWAAVFSFSSFAGGALVPLLPFLFVRGPGALAASIGVTAVNLFVVGALISLFTGKSAAASGLRMLAIGAAAGALTFTVGKLLGVTIG